ncbi:MAG: cyclic nucleotide-binding domain-containing protein [Nitrospiraceae bacterium]
MSFLSPDYFIHAANILLLIAYCVRDVLWLRVFAVAASLIAIPYYVLQPTMLWEPVAWSVIFAAINLVQSWLLFLERRPVKLTAEEEEIYRLAFQGLPLRKVLQVLSIGSWITAEVGERLMERGKLPDSISLMLRGKVRVMKDERMILDLIPGNFVGSALILSGIPSDVDAVTVEPVRAMRWEIGTLKKYLSANPETRNVMQGHLAHDLAGKIERLVTDSDKPSDKNP